MPWSMCATMEKLRIFEMSVMAVGYGGDWCFRQGDMVFERKIGPEVFRLVSPVTTSMQTHLNLIGSYQFEIVKIHGSTSVYTTLNIATLGAGFWF